MSPLPQALRRLAPNSVRDDVRLRALALGAGLIPPRTMHSPADAAVLRAVAGTARRAVEIGVYEGASALLLLDALPPGAELHLIDPFGHHPDALPGGWGASERATRAVLARAARRRRGEVRLVWHVELSHEAARLWSGEVDLVFIDGDHSREGCERDWQDWRSFVPPGGHVVFHDARAGRADGRGLPGPTSVVEEGIRDGRAPGWEIEAEADRTVAVRRA
jgi:predicted O-methyltransferase YrrM